LGAEARKWKPVVSNGRADDGAIERTQWGYEQNWIGACSLKAKLYRSHDARHWLRRVIKRESRYLRPRPKVALCDP
jgi:hypothetical protein